MAHRRAVVRSGAWRVWLLVPLALVLDIATALGLEGRARPFGVTIPEGVLLAAPLFVYVTLALLMLWTWPLASRLVAAAVLLSLHAGLVAVHAILFMSLWSLSVPAALRLAHRWSPLVPLLQLVWVPLLALPLVTLGDRRQRSVAPRPIPRRVPVEVLLHRASRVPAPKRAETDRRLHVNSLGVGDSAPPAQDGAVTVSPSPSEASAAPPDANIQIVVETARDTVDIPPPPPPAPRPAPASMAPPAPTWFDELLEPATPSDPSTLPGPEPIVAAAVDAAAAQPAPVPPGEPRDRAPLALPADAMSSRDEPASLVRLEDIAAAPVSFVASPLEPEGLQLPEEIPPAPAPVAAAPVADRGSQAAATEAVESEVAAAPDTLPVVASPQLLEPPVDLDLVARTFAPYGPLLSRDREVAAHWTSGPGVPVVCVAPADLGRDQIVGLAARLAPVLAPLAPPALGPVRRLSLRGPDGAVVLTPLDGAVLAAAARRRGAVALLEALSARAVAGAAGSGTDDPAPDDTPAAPEASASSAIRVETGAATLDVLAPDDVAAAAVGDLAGRLLAAVHGGPFVLDSLSVDFGPRRLMVRPINPLATPPRFVAVIGGATRPGLLARLVGRAAKTLREAS